jgi:hypothetical protein
VTGTVPIWRDCPHFPASGKWGLSLSCHSYSYFSSSSSTSMLSGISLSLVATIAV